MPHATLEARRKYQRKYHALNKGRLSLQKRAYYEANKDRFDEYHKKYREENRDKVRAWSRERARMVRSKVKEALGGKCTCCGETEFEFLTIDHVHNDGPQDRVRFKRPRGTNISVYVYEEIFRDIRDGRPVTKYQLHCFNCNSSKHFGHGMCVHERKRLVAISNCAGRTE